MARNLASPWTPLAAVAIALLLTLVSIDNGLLLDDYFHRAVLSGSPRFAEYLPGPQGMFRFVNGDAERMRAAMDVGFWPWFTDPSIKAELFYLIPTQTRCSSTSTRDCRFRERSACSHRPRTK